MPSAKTIKWGQVALIILGVAILYGQTLNAPFYLDDHRGIAGNNLLRDLPAVAERIFSQRGLTNLTFALNYRLTAWSLPPLHLVNIALHAGCGLLVWLVLRRLFARDSWLPLFGALLFIAHPLQTEGVTYLVQRATTLGAAFFLLAFFCHLRAREALAAGFERTAPAYVLPYAGAVLAGACAVLAKENTAPLPLVLIAYDRLFPLPLQRTRRQGLSDYLPFFIVPLILGGVVLGSPWFRGESLAFHSELDTLQGNTPLHYLVTQFSVIWIYLRMLFAPYGLALEHNYPVVAQLLTGPQLLGLGGLLALAWLAWGLRLRRPLVTFGIAWFFLTLAVESSVIPLDPLFEHRLYLPMFGFLLAMLDGLSVLAGRQWTLVVCGIALMACLPLTWQRNALWNDQIAFYEDNLRVAPGSERASRDLAVLYRKAQRFDEGRLLLEKAVQDKPSRYFLYGDLAGFYVARGDADKGLQLLETGMTLNPAYADFYEAAANICKVQGDGQRALGYLLRGLAVQGADRGRLLNTLGVYYSDLGMSTQAEMALRESLQLPINEKQRATAYMNLAREYYFQRRWAEVVDFLRKVLQLSPGDPEVLERLGEAAMRLGDEATARQVADKLEYADPERWHRLQAAMRSVGWR